MPLTDFSPYLKNGVLDLNEEGYKFSGGKGGIRCFKDIFDIKRLAEFIQNTPNITAFKAVMWGIGEMGIDNFQLLMEAINDSKITDLNFENNSLNTEMAKAISQLYKITTLNLDFSNIGNEGIVKIVDNLSNLEDFDARGNYLTDEVVDAIVKGLPKIKVLKIGYGNNISCEKLQEIAKAHSTLTAFDIYSSAYDKLKMLDVVTLLPAGVVKIGVNDNINAPLNLVEAVGENNNAPPPVDPVELGGDIREGE
ncbi:MAG: hypothetical protein DMENIID0002_08220 [Rickettsia endosymbiont of Sergentomyia squamirostris]|uniref:Uncharacterized protein n=1 Tax=Candidatus Tisiphia endosymbiont of Sergentomyia squamirostris TaxID=3113639 RepID=A0AAT9G8X4_9RICK